VTATADPAVLALERAVRRAGFAALLDGRAPTGAEVARAAGVPDAAAAAVLAGLVAQGRATLTRDGRVDGIAGVTRRAGRHAIDHSGAWLWTWCAFDALAIPAALGWTATAVTTCGGCAADIRVTLDAGVPFGTAWGWLPPDDCEHVLRDFCAAADLFCHRDHLDAWRVAAGDPAGEARSVADLAEIGRAAWADCLPSAGS
jgi:hypothetical protein